VVPHSQVMAEVVEEDIEIAGQTQLSKGRDLHPSKPQINDRGEPSFPKFWGARPLST
jgi:hypothetical protein